MKYKMFVFLTISGLLASALLVYVLSDGDQLETESPRELASTLGEYEAMGACEKQDLLWRKVKATEYKTLPDFQKFGAGELWGLSRQAISYKGNHHSDFVPKGWKKFLHARGALAKVKIVSRGSGYTGIFRGADCGFLRLSLTFKPVGSRAVAPGLALKVLRDRAQSANVSALVSLSGQARDYNFFRNPLSNIVPIGESFGEKVIHHIFGKVTTYPEELLASDMAAVDSRGDRVQDVVAPRQLFFVPGPGLSFTADEHDVRHDFLKIPEGTVVYRLMAASDKRRNFDYANYKGKDAQAFLNDAQHVADIVTTSEFVASAFGDDGMFFRHQIRP